MAQERSFQDDVGGEFNQFDPARGQRIGELMLGRGLRYNCQLCYDIGVSESTLSRWRSGRPFSLEHAIKLSLALGASLDYLLTGRTVSTEQSSFSSQLSELLSLYPRLTPDNEELSLSLLRSLSCRPAPEPRTTLRAGGAVDTNLAHASAFEAAH